MLSIPFLIFMYFTDWLIVYTYIKTIYKTRKRFSFLVSLGFYAALLFIYKHITSAELFGLIFTLISNILCIFACFKSTYKSALFHGVSLTLSQLISKVISTVMIPIFGATSLIFIKDLDVTVYPVNTIISKLFFLLICRLLLRFSSKENANKTWGRWVSLSILPISSICIILVIYSLTSYMLFSNIQRTACVVALVLLLIANVVVYYIYEKAEKNNQKLTELELANQKNEINMQYLTLLEEKNDKMNIMAHDFKNHLVTINEMSDLSDVKNYINQMFHNIGKYTRLAKTKNRLLDVILNKYTDMCEAKEIRFEVNASTDNLDFIESYDLSALFNNILDNSYEAAVNSGAKYIYLEITKVLGSYHKIIVKNSSDKPPKTHHDKLISTKKNKELHGYGTKSIQNVVNKYNGELQWEYNNQSKEFKLIILIPDNNLF